MAAARCPRCCHLCVFSMPLTGNLKHDVGEGEVPLAAVHAELHQAVEAVDCHQAGEQEDQNASHPAQAGCGARE